MTVALPFYFTVTVLAQSFLPPRFAISNVSVITMSGNRVLTGHAVIIDQDTIHAIVPAARLSAYKPITVVNGQGGYLMPGLTESHCHLSAHNSDWLQVYLDFGITSIHIMTGSDHAYSWRNLVQKGKLRAPDILLASPLIDGNPPIWGALHKGPVVENPDSVGHYIDEYTATGTGIQPYDMLKLYARLSAPVFFRFLELAKKAGVKVAAHIPAGLPRDSLLHPFLSRIEHLSGYGRSCSALDSFTDKQKSYRMDHILDRAGFVRISGTRMADAVAQTIRHGIWNCPTQTMFENETDTLLQQFLLGSSLAGSFPGLTGWWRSLDNKVTAEQLAGLQNRRRLIKALHDAGAGILAGTDSPNPFLFPGLALHQELINYCEKAGLTPFETLQTATVNPGVFMGRRTGKIEKGYKAHLVLLWQNPLEKISNTLSLVWTLKDRVLYSNKTAAEFYDYYQNR